MKKMLVFTIATVILASCSSSPSTPRLQREQLVDMKPYQDKIYDACVNYEKNIGKRPEKEIPMWCNSSASLAVGSVKMYFNQNLKRTMLDTCHAPDVIDPSACLKDFQNESYTSITNSFIERQFGI